MRGALTGCRRSKMISPGTTRPLWRRLNLPHQKQGRTPLGPGTASSPDPAWARRSSRQMRLLAYSRNPLALKPTVLGHRGDHAACGRLAGPRLGVFPTITAASPPDREVAQLGAPARRWRRWDSSDLFTVNLTPPLGERGRFRAWRTRNSAAVRRRSTGVCQLRKSGTTGQSKLPPTSHTALASLSPVLCGFGATLSPAHAL